MSENENSLYGMINKKKSKTNVKNIYDLLSMFEETIPEEDMAEILVNGFEDNEE